MPFNLPADAAEFLRAGKQLRYDLSRCEPGEVKLKTLAQLTNGEIWISADPGGDPDGGYYAVPAVSLTGECEDYDPEYILLWLPNERLFGTWDADHWTLTVFHGATWSDIVADPATYLNAQWDDHAGVGSPFIPEQAYERKSGRPF